MLLHVVILCLYISSSLLSLNVF